MKRLLFILLGLAIATFIGCGDDSRANASDVPTLGTAIHFVPSSHYGISYLQFPSVRTKTLSRGESGKFAVEVRLNGETLSEEIKTNYIQNFIWNIEGKDYISNSVSHAFDSAGITDVTLRTVDFFLDTLADTMTIFVDTPLEISQTFPENGHNVAPFDSSGISFTVKTDGIDPWEYPECQLFLSTDKTTLWDTLASDIPCNGTYRFNGPLLSGDSLDFRDSSVLYYWAVRARITGSDLAFDSAFSGIRTFRTALVGTESSHLVVPVRYRSLSTNLSPSGAVILRNKAGDTLATGNLERNPSVLHLTGLAAEDSLQLSLFDKTLPEYGRQTISFNLSKSSYTVLDTVFLADTIPPTRLPAESKIVPGDSLHFYLYDGGAGISTASLTIALDGDTIARSISGSVAAFQPLCNNRCKLALFLRDNAGNKAADIHWILAIDSEDSLDILGPYNPEDP